MKRDTLLQRALARQPVERPPVWLMRQAGRYLPEYREVRAEAGGFLEMVRDPALSAEVTLQPIRRFNMDAAIVFSDILMPLEAMGMDLFFDERGPVLSSPLRTRSDVEALREVDPHEDLAYVGETLRRVRAGLPDECSLLGFCGAPFTLATYAIEGGSSRSFLDVRRIMYREPELWNELCERLADLVAAHLAYQVESGADAVVLFDTWAGSLTREDWERYAAPWARKVLDRLRGVAPRVVFGGGADHLLEGLADLGAEAVAVDHRTDLAGAFERVGDRVALQGNLDPAVLLATPEEVSRRTRALLDSVRGRRGHVLNLGHGVLKTTDPACVGAFVEAAREERCLPIS